jgi:hypothetical protein
LYEQDQRQTWGAIQRSATGPALQSFFAKPYSSERFEELIAALIPARLGAAGWYCTPSLHAYSVPSGRVFETATVLDIQRIESIEQPNFGEELAQRLGQEQLVVRQRLIVHPIPDGHGIGGVAFDHAYYGAIAQRSDSLDREVNGIITGEAKLMEQLKIADQQGPNFNLNISLDNLRSELRSGADAWDLSRTTMRTLFFGMVHNLIERGREKRQSPNQVVRRMREEIVDRHEGSHLLDEWDPQQRIYKAFYSRLADDLNSYRSALRFYLFHGEVDAAIGELRYGEPTIALDRLLAFTGPEYDPAHRALNSIDEHYRSRLWVRDILVRMLAGSWSARAGTKFVAGLPHDDQAKIQLFLLAQPNNQSILRALADAIKAKHDEAYLDPDEMMRRVNQVN